MRRGIGLMLSGALSALTACSSSTGPVTSTFLRAINASPDAPPLEIYVDGVRLIENLPLAQPTRYIGIASGPAALKVVTSDSASLLSTATQFATGRSYSLFVLGPVDSLAVLILTDSTSAPADSARVRFVNASPTDRSVDVYVKALGSATPAAPTFAAVAFDRATPYILTQSVALEVVVTSAGSKTVVVDDTLASVPGGAVRTVVALDHAGGGPPITTLNLANTG